MRIVRWIVFIGVFLLIGCVSQDVPGRVGRVYSLAQDRKSIERYIKAQDAGYTRLKSDLSRDQLKYGISKEEVIRRYAEPVYCKKADDGSNEVCLYRRPTEYFTSNVVLLYFDSGQRLESWELMSESE